MRPIKQNPGAYFVAFQTYLTIESNRVPICDGGGNGRILFEFLSLFEVLHGEDMRRSWTPCWSMPMTGQITESYYLIFDLETNSRLTRHDSPRVIKNPIVI